MKKANAWTVSRVMVFGAVSLVGVAGIIGSDATSGSGSGTTSPSGQGSFFIEYNNTYDQTGDDVGGAKTPVDVPVVWVGSRQGSEGASGDAFNISSTWHGFATDPWNTTTIVPQLNPGNWNISVTVNGLTMSCQSVIALKAGSTTNVTFQISKESGQFTGCTHN